MGIDIDGKLLIGCYGEDINIGDHDDINDWAEANEVSEASPHYDCGTDERFYGFDVDPIMVKDMDQEWLDDLKKKGDRFKEISGHEAMLIGIQNVW